MRPSAPLATAWTCARTAAARGVRCAWSLAIFSSAPPHSEPSTASWVSKPRPFSPTPPLRPAGGWPATSPVGAANPSFSLTPTRSKPAAAPDPSPTRQFQPVGENAVPLLYGNSYDFRVRLSDLARGGPQVGDSPINPAPAPVGTIPFRRYTPPKTVTITNLDASATPANPQTMYSIQRPRLGYPDLVFTGYPDAIAALLADIPNAKAQQRDVGLPDPDVVSLGIDVEVRQLDQDAAAITATDLRPTGCSIRPRAISRRSHRAPQRQRLLSGFPRTFRFPRATHQRKRRRTHRA